MRRLPLLPMIVALLGACIAGVEQETQHEPTASPPEPGAMPPHGGGPTPGDPCSVALVFDETGHLVAVPSECVTEPEVDDGDPPPEADNPAEQSILPPH